MKRPLKAPSLSITDKELEKLPYPVFGSPKLDGFRCVIVNGLAKTSSMKNIQNTFVFDYLSRKEFSGLDGELVVGKSNSPDTFNNTSGPLRRFDGCPDFTFFVFDRFGEDNLDYYDRWLASVNVRLTDKRIIKLKQTPLNSPEAVIEYTDKCIASNYEGAMIRTGSGLYKQGRATFKEMNIFKRKPLQDAEAKIIGFVEQMTNENEQEINEMGLTKRSSNAEYKVPANTLGSFILSSPLWLRPFNCGGGCLTHAERKEIWDNVSKYSGKTVTFKYQAHGSLDAPRQPVFRRFYAEI